MGLLYLGTAFCLNSVEDLSNAKVLRRDLSSCVPFLYRRGNRPVGHKGPYTAEGPTTALVLGAKCCTALLRSSSGCVGLAF